MPGVKPKSRSHRRKKDSDRSTAPRKGHATAVKDLSSIDDLVERLKRECDEDGPQHGAATSNKAQRPDASQTTADPSVTPLALHRSRLSGRGALEEAQLALFAQEAQGDFVSEPLRPAHEYPTILTRIPIFVPGRRTNQRAMLDEDNAIPFATPWGTGKKHGPPLTVYDEDTLIAIGLLRDSQLVGRPAKMPISVPEHYRRKDQTNVTVHIVTCMLSDIQDVCGTSQGGHNNRLRLDSVRRLSNTSIELTAKTPGRDIIRGTSIKLIDVAWESYEENAVLVIQFSPIMALWFEQHYSYLDWSLRRKLSDTGKAIHRFLSGQPPYYEIRAAKLMATIGYMRPSKEFMRDLRQALKQLQEEGWVERYEITGSGRKTPHLLKVQRRKGRKDLEGPDTAANQTGRESA